MILKDLAHGLVYFWPFESKGLPTWDSEAPHAVQTNNYKQLKQTSWGVIFFNKYRKTVVKPYNTKRYVRRLKLKFERKVRSLLIGHHQQKVIQKVTTQTDLIMLPSLTSTSSDWKLTLRNTQKVTTGGNTTG